MNYYYTPLSDGKAGFNPVLLSPDGFPTIPTPAEITTLGELYIQLEHFKKRYEEQGYYSTSNIDAIKQHQGRIPLPELWKFCFLADPSNIFDQCELPEALDAMEIDLPKVRAILVCDKGEDLMTDLREASLGTYDNDDSPDSDIERSFERLNDDYGTIEWYDLSDMTKEQIDVLIRLNGSLFEALFYSAMDKEGQDIIDMLCEYSEPEPIGT